MKEWKAPEMTEIEVRDTFTGTYTSMDERIASTGSRSYYAPLSN